MAKQHNVEKSHKGEPMEILLSAKNPDGTALSDPLTQTIKITIGRKPEGDPFLSYDSSPQVSLVDEGNSQWLIQLTETNLAGLEENVRYYYNVWSQAAGDEPRLQAYGRLTRKPSI